MHDLKSASKANYSLLVQLSDPRSGELDDELFEALQLQA
jgi:hypothetical protein